MTTEQPTFDLGLTKPCTLCREELPIEEFPVVKRRARRARGSWCKACIRSRAREYYAANREARKAAVRAYAAENAEIVRERRIAYYRANRAEILAQQREYRRANPKVRRHSDAAWRERHREQERERHRRRYAENPAREYARTSAWAKANPERMRAHFATRRARKLARYVEYVDRHRVFERDAGICGLCGDPVDLANWQLDHVIPLARGGEHSYANTQVTHPRCNQSKGARLPDEMPAAAR